MFCNIVHCIEDCGCCVWSQLSDYESSSRASRYLFWIKFIRLVSSSSTTIPTFVATLTSPYIGMMLGCRSWLKKLQQKTKDKQEMRHGVGMWNKPYPSNLISSSCSRSALTSISSFHTVTATGAPKKVPLQTLAVASVPNSTSPCTSTPDCKMNTTSTS